MFRRALFILYHSSMPSPKFRADLLTIFPEPCESYCRIGMLGRAQKEGIAKMTAHDLRTWTHDAHKTVDDKPFGGGPGMVMKIEPFHEALVSLKVRTKNGTKTAQGKKACVISTSAKGKMFTHADAIRLVKKKQLVFLCGRYEGIDERINEYLVDEEFCIGPYVLTGGELPALVMLDAIVRHLPGVLGEPESLTTESWADGSTREYPQYTRPESYGGWEVPKILLSGDHQKIKTWRHEKKV